MVSVLFNEPKLLKLNVGNEFDHRLQVSVLFNEPKLLKSSPRSRRRWAGRGFSALQRAEIAEIPSSSPSNSIQLNRFSALQRAEIAEMQMKQSK